MYVCMCLCTYVCMYVRMYVRMYVCMYVCMCVCMYVCMYLCMYVCMCVCVYDMHKKLYSVSAHVVHVCTVLERMHVYTTHLRNPPAGTKQSGADGGVALILTELCPSLSVPRGRTVIGSPFLLASYPSYHTPFILTLLAMKAGSVGMRLVRPYSVVS